MTKGDIFFSHLMNWFISTVNENAIIPNGFEFSIVKEQRRLTLANNFADYHSKTKRNEKYVDDSYHLSFITVSSVECARYQRNQSYRERQIVD